MPLEPRPPAVTVTPVALRDEAAPDACSPLEVLPVVETVPPVRPSTALASALTASKPAPVVEIEPVLVKLPEAPPRAHRP